MKALENRAPPPKSWLARLSLAGALTATTFALHGCAAGSSYRSEAPSPPPSSSYASGGAMPASAPMAEATTVSEQSAPGESAGDSVADNEGASVHGSSDSGEEAPAPAAQAAPAPARVERVAVAMTSGTSGAPSRPATQPRPPASNRGPATNTGPGTNTGQNTTPGAQNQQPAQAPAPMLIYVAEVQLQTQRSDIPQTIERVIEAATSIGGYLVRRTDDSVQVRVPSLRFRESLARVETFGEVLHRSVSADDVSEEYRDIEVRLQNLRAVRRRLEEFLQRASTMQDALNVEHELERVTREIDTLEGRLRFLGARVAFSLVTVHVQARPEHVDMATPDPSPTRRLLNLPVEWLSRLGLERLMDVGQHD